MSEKMEEKLEEINLKNEFKMSISNDYSMLDFREYEYYVNKTVVVLLRDNSFLYGTFKSYDQFNSISLNYVTQRLFYKNKYAEKRIGLIALRGENIVFIAIAKCNTNGLEKMEYEELETIFIEKRLSLTN